MNPNLAKLPKDWQKVLVGLYKEGASDTEVRAELRMTKGVWDSLYSDSVNTEFREIVDFGHTFSKAWWLTKARKSLNDRTFNANLWLMVMKNQFGWSEKSEVVTKEAADLSDDELRERIQEIQKKINKVDKS